jgi:serine protease Do
MKCPKCGHEQPAGPECGACGIVIEKFLRRQREIEEQALYGESDARGSGAGPMRIGVASALVLSDGTEHIASIVRSSDAMDLTLLGIGESDCHYLKGGAEDDLEHGDRLFTIGSPIGLRHSVTSGVFSGFLDFEDRRLIQTDAPINPGNSGGPLINEEGRVLGINTLKVMDADGVGFAIPFSLARRELNLE